MKINYTLASVLGLLVLFWILILGQRWIPVHDTLVSLLWAHQYVSAGITGGWGAWIPTVNWGQPLSFPVLAWVSPSTILLIPFAKLFSHPNVATLFYLGLFLDELVLVLGTYLLSRQLFKRNLTVFAVTVLLVGSVNWSAQIFFNFRIYYAVPLSLYFVFTGCRDRSLSRYLTGWLVVPLTAMYGSLFYVALLQGATLIVFSALCLFRFGSFRLRFTKREIQKLAAIAFLFICAIGIPVLFGTHGEFPGIISPGREAGGLTNYETFLNWVSDPHFASFGDAFDGVLEEYDSSIYGGFLLLPFLAIALLFSPFRSLLPFLASGLFLFLFSLGKASFLAPLLYYVPGFSHYRHITYAVPLLKVMLIFTAGFGIERFFDSLSEKSRERKPLLLTALGFTIFTFAISLWHFRIYSRMGVSFSSHRMLLVLVLRASAALCFARLLINHRHFQRFAVGVLITLICVDIFSYRALRYSEKLVSLSEDTWNLFRARAPSFQARRSERPVVPNASRSFLPYAQKLGVLYAVTDAFLDADPCLHAGRSDLATLGVAKIYPRATEKAILPAGLKVAAACANPKFFITNQLKIVPTEEELRVSLSESSTTIFTTGDEYTKYRAAATGLDRELIPSEEKQSGNVIVDNFHSDSVELSVNSKSGENWLYYADAWHPDWTAKVNGLTVPILKTNLAFKAIKIPAGKSKVEFSFYSPVRQILNWLIWILLCGFYAAVLRATYRETVHGKLVIGKRWPFAQFLLPSGENQVSAV